MNHKRVSGRYEIIRPVGGGGMADVYLAKDLILDRTVAVKMLKEQFSKDEEFIRRFRREAQSATSLSHPNVVNIYDVGEEEDLYYIVMEYVEGQTLKDYINEKGRLSVSETVRILEQIVAAVSHAHDNHIVHRDIKPHNILMSKDGEAKVTDFGIARAISEATITHTNSVLGSVHYLSPEQARGGQVTYKSDLYSLGVVTYEMLSGEVPFSGDTAVSVAIKHLQEPLPLLREKDSAIPQSIENFVIKATAKDPFKRFNSAEDMLLDLSTILDEGRRDEAPYQISDPDEEVTKAIPAAGIQGQTDQEETIVPSKTAGGTNVFHNSKPAAEQPDIKKKEKGAKFWVKASLLALVFFIGLIFLIFYLIPTWLHVNEVEIPDGLQGMEYNEAFETLMELNLEVEQELRHDDEMEEGHVITHRPGAGQSVKEGTIVTLVVSEGSEPVEMEDLIGQSRERAEDLLQDFDDFSIQFEETSEYDDDTVIDQSPEPGSMVVPQETVVRLTVSERPTYIMSNLYDMTREEVLATFEGNDLIDLKIEEEYHSTVEEGRVITQYPPRGTEIREHTTVNAVFSKGQEPIEEPEEEPVSATVPFKVEVPDDDNADEDTVENAGENNGENNDSNEEGNNNDESNINNEDAGDDEERPSYRIRLSVTDMDNRTPLQIVDEEITEDTTFDVPMTVAPEDSGFIILFVGDEEFEDSPYEYTYDELKEYQ